MLYNCSCFKYVSGVLVVDVVVVFSCQCWTSNRFFLVTQHAAIQWAFLSLFVLLKIPQKKSMKTVVQLGTEGIISLYVCLSPWKKSILFFSFACSTFLKVLKETKTEINIIITLNLGSTNYERLLHWGLGLRKKRLLVLDVCLLIPCVKQKMKWETFLYTPDWTSNPIRLIYSEKIPDVCSEV